MLKNMSFLALAGSLAFVSISGCIIVTDDGSTQSSASVGDGDGDGDGDGTSETGSGDGDGDGAGDGDGDGAGDGDGTPGDGDGDGAPASCGWVEDPDFPGYYCDGSGEDPAGMVPIACPDGLVEGDACDVTGLTGSGCCDADGNNWYCGEENGVQSVVFVACGG